VPPQIMMWDTKNLTGNVLTRDIVEAAKAWVPQMKEEGADIVIALSHSGIDIKPGEMMENASFHPGRRRGHRCGLHGAPASRLPRAEGFCRARGRRCRKGHCCNGKPAVMGGFWGSHMGLIDLLLERTATSGKSFRRRPRRGRSTKREEKTTRTRSLLATVQSFVEAALKEDHEATLAYVRRPVGKTSAPLYSYFALVADDPSVQIVSQAQTWYIKDMLKDTQWKDLPVLSAAAPFKAGGRGGAGLLHRRAGRRHRDQECRRPLPLSEHGARGCDHRRAGQGMAGNVSRHLQPGRGWQGRPAADQPGFPILQFRCHRRRDLQDRPVAAAKYEPKGAVLNAKDPTASRT
jgi:2',3'-cyclic-nucleotide 2'-phosphodiesterase/3'-nucleotidase